MNFFSIKHKSSRCSARCGIIHTEHGNIETPVFMPVGTQATVKSLDGNDLRDIQAQIILANTYHLHLRPGEKIINNFRGLHKFMNWNKPILTDSGGFQVFSLGQSKRVIRSKNNEQQGSLVKIDKNGVSFKSHIDGSTHRFTPESAIRMQHKIGADIIMAFDECAPDKIDKPYAIAAMDRTHGWAERCLLEHDKNKKHHGYRQYLFGIIQGSRFRDLRRQSARFISELDFDGIAVGGESIGHDMENTKKILDWITPLVPKQKPLYTMGVGNSPTDLLQMIERGVDMFDCVSPSRIARNGTLFVEPRLSKKMKINITNAKFKKDGRPVDPHCGCYSCSNFSRSYIHHLFNAGELLAYRLATIHNLFFLTELMTQARQSIREDRFLRFKKTRGLN